MRHIAGLYLNPPDKAVVLRVDEKSHIQALEQHQPVLPMGPGYAQGVRHGTTTLFAALDIATGEVAAQCKHRHRRQDYLAFLRYLDIHLLADNYATHKHAKSGLGWRGGPDTTSTTRRPKLSG